MKLPKNKNQQKGQQQDIGNKRKNAGNQGAIRNTEKESTMRQTGALNAPEKKPISHRTGDATNFGDRSYKED